MKLQLDTTRKTIKVEGNVVISELISTLERLFPNAEWKEMTLETNVTINNWTAPFVIERNYPKYPIQYPLYSPTNTSPTFGQEYKVWPVTSSLTHLL